MFGMHCSLILEWFFFYTGAAMEVNISHRTRQEILTTVDLAHPDLFNKAINELLQLMKMVGFLGQCNMQLLLDSSLNYNIETWKQIWRSYFLPEELGKRLLDVHVFHQIQRRSQYEIQWPWPGTDGRLELLSQIEFCAWRWWSIPSRTSCEGHWLQ